jgi:hypothetical protein
VKSTGAKNRSARGTIFRHLDCARNKIFAPVDFTLIRERNQTLPQDKFLLKPLVEKKLEDLLCMY